MTNINKIIVPSFFTSLLVFLLYGEHSILYNLLGQISSFEKVNLFNVCGEVFCRGLIYNLFIYIFFNSLEQQNVIIYSQIFIFFICTFILMDEMKKNGINKYLILLFLCLLIFNPRFIKYSFNHGDEAIVIPILILYCSFIIKFVRNRRYTTYIGLYITAILIFLTKSGTLPVLLITFFLNFLFDFELKKKIISFILSIVFIFILQKLTFLLIEANNNIKNNYYLHIHLLSATIANSNIVKENNDILNQLVNKKIIRKKMIYEEIEKNNNNKLFFKCVIFPALNNYVYDDVEIKSFFENKDNLQSIKKIPINYIKRFFKEPYNFISHYFNCTYSNFIFVEFVSEENYNKNIILYSSQKINDHEKKIINSFLINSNNYFDNIIYYRLLGIFFIGTVFTSFATSLYSVKIKKNDKNDIINLICFFLFITIIFIHVNIVHSQSRWFFTYIPIAMINFIILINKILFYFNNHKKISN